jgi:signal recognition particle subunit SRP54
MLVGLFGSGKTTTAGKLAKYFSKQGLRPALVTADFHRPAALEQLSQIGKQINIPVFYEKDPYTSVKKGLEKFAKYDTIIFDTAGRNALDVKLADELKKLKELINPDEVLLVIPADLGKVARTQAEEFHKLAGVTGVIITKMDGTAKAGGSLAATSVTNAKVKFIGVGEKLEALELYDPQRFVSRLLGLGDLETLLEKAKEAEIKPETAEKMLEGKFTLQDFMEQIESISKMGSLGQIMKMIPGVGGANIPDELLEMQETKLKKFKYIIQSLTKEERNDPDIIDASRIKRCAKGAGVAESEVRDLLKQYEQMKKVSKMFSGRGQKNLMNLMKRFGGKLPF